MENIVGSPAWSIALPVIGIVLFIVILVFLVLLITNIKTIYETLSMNSSKIDSLKDSFDNVVSGSKRMERNIDAINQRTRAHLVNKDREYTPAKHSSSYSNNGDRKDGKKTFTHKKRGNFKNYRIVDDSYVEPSNIRGNK